MSQETRYALRQAFTGSADLMSALDEIARYTASDDSEIEDLTDFAIEVES